MSRKSGACGGALTGQTEREGILEPMRFVFAAIALLLVLPGCSKGAAGASGSEQSAPQAEITDSRVACAVGGAKVFTPVCTLDALHEANKEIWVVHHPDGGFRRFQILDNGKIIATADGAFEVQAARVGSELEVKVGDDRYRFPATPETDSSATGV